MVWNKHSNLIGQHALLSPSKPSWLKYDKARLIEYEESMQAIERGTRLHAFAAECIRLGQKLPKSKKTLNSYVNDAIGFRMDPEVLLYYDDYCYGTADTISFNDNFLRIHDLKTGVSPTHIEQPMIYAALFCLEYAVDPKEIRAELRIYQSDDILAVNPEPEEIRGIMNTIANDVKALRSKKSDI